MMMTSRKMRIILATLIPMAAMPALAAPSLSSSSYVLGANVNVAGIVNASVGPVPTASGTSPASYNQSNSVASVNQTLSLINLPLIDLDQRFTTGVATATAASNFPVTSTATSSATVNGLGTRIDLTTGTPPIVIGPITIPGISTVQNLLSVNARTISSNASIGSAMGLAAFGETIIEGLQVNVLGLGSFSLAGALNASIAANTVLVDVLGLKITLNEQFSTGDGITGLDFTTNALHASFNNFLLGGNLFNGDVVVAQSRVSAAGFVPGAVPEPATWAMMIGGFGLIGSSMRRRAPTRTLAAA